MGKRAVTLVGAEVLDKLAYANSNGTVSFGVAEPQGENPLRRRGVSRTK